MNYEKGDIVISIAGRDCGQIFLVWSLQGDDVFLVNGKLRKINSPKKKNVKHIMFKNKSPYFKQMCDKGQVFNDALVRKILKCEENL